MSAQTIHAEVSGCVWKIVVAVGDTIDADQELIILESMKMEIPALAPHAGVVRSILVAQGEAVGEGQALLVVDRISRDGG